ncbi:hypothetical protein EJ08DRAFT_682094 [Tothia fuscella]|uniref:CID domain-containing protein n=1 Tax=Tothia fuscella TaxID=1048955 RepID=A0A9P4TVC4_9PEZI|nr:hypothetical protein EJ08DRAFT_682094 [Tothia fuscella]
MSDPFAIRMNFKRSYLEKMTSSPVSQQRAAAYALRYKDQDEDLHSCILEQLENSNINLRANIMYFIEHLCDAAKREGHLDYVRNVERDLGRICDLVAPGERGGATNIKVVRKVLQNLQNKSLLQQSSCSKVESAFTSREITALSKLSKSLPPTTTSTTAMDIDPPSQATTSKPDGIHELDEKDVEQRMEEDRERHKRTREDMWAVDPEEELELLYESGRGGLTAQLLRDCVDDGKGRVLAMRMDGMGVGGV